MQMIFRIKRIPEYNAMVKILDFMIRIADIKRNQIRILVMIIIYSVLFTSYYVNYFLAMFLQKFLIYPKH